MKAMPKINLAATGRNIKRLRNEAGITVSDLQQIFGFSTPQAIYKWQRGESLPALDNIVVLADVFGVTIENIVSVGNDPCQI